MTLRPDRTGYGGRAAAHERHDDERQREGDAWEEAHLMGGWYSCPGCRENPVRGFPGDLPLCSECQDPDPIEEPS